MSYFNPNLNNQLARGHCQVIWQRTKPSMFWMDDQECRMSSPHWWPIAFYNSGQHLYLTTGAPRFITAVEQAQFQPLSFRRYCHGGNCNGVNFRHLGHMYGIHGGPAEVEIELQGIKTLLRVKPKNFAWLYEGQKMVCAVEYQQPVNLGRVPWMYTPR